MQFTPRKEFNKVIVININWLLFSGALLIIFALVILTNILGPQFSRLSCQLCLVLTSVVLVIHSVRFWFTKWIMFVCHLFYDTLYVLVAVLIHGKGNLQLVFFWVLVAYGLLAVVRLYSYSRMHRGIDQIAKPLSGHNVVHIDRHERALKRAWRLMLFSGLVDIALVVAMVLMPIQIKSILTVVSVDMLVSGLVFFRLGMIV